MILLLLQGRFDQVRIADDVDGELVPRQGGLDKTADGGIVIDHHDADIARAVHAAALDGLQFFLRRPRVHGIGGGGAVGLAGGIF